MIGKQTKGQSFRGVLNYLHHKERAQRIGGNMAGKTPRILAAEFRAARDLNPRLTKAVYHASLSLPKTEHLSNDRWNAIADDYINGMGFEGSQYVTYRHGDKDHDHVHIVASRVRITDGSTVSDSWDYPRSEKLIRSLEQQYDLTPAPPSHTRDSKAPTTGERRRYQRTGEPNVRGPLRDQVEHATEGGPTMPHFLKRLKSRGVNARLNTTRTGKIRGISYELDGVAFSGSKLGKAYTFPGLQKYRSVSYEPEMKSSVEAVSQQPPATAAEQAQQQQRTHALASFLDKVLNYYDVERAEGQRYQVQRDDNHLTLTRRHSDETLMQADWSEAEETWQATEPLNLTAADLEHLRGFRQQFQQQLQDEYEQRQRELRRQRQRERSKERELEL